MLFEVQLTLVPTLLKPGLVSDVWPDLVFVKTDGAYLFSNPRSDIRHSWHRGLGKT